MSKLIWPQTLSLLYVKLTRPYIVETETYNRNSRTCSDALLSTKYCFFFTDTYLVAIRLSLYPVNPISYVWAQWASNHFFSKFNYTPLMCRSYVTHSTKKRSSSVKTTVLIEKSRTPMSKINQTRFVRYEGSSLTFGTLIGLAERGLQFQNVIGYFFVIKPSLNRQTSSSDHFLSYGYLIIP